MVHKIANFGPNYTPPLSEVLCTILLAKEKNKVLAATEIVRSSWGRNDITMIADGWSDTRSQSIHSTIA
eukprot:c32098_g1_i1 orf=72-278(-)